jgi:hypothetical protein
MGYYFESHRHIPEPTTSDVEALRNGFKQVTDRNLHSKASLREQDSRWLLEATESVIADMESRIRYVSLTFEEKASELPKEAKERIEKSFDRVGQTRREVENQSGIYGGYIMTLAVLRVGMERILRESCDDASRHRSTNFIAARKQILAALWLAMESARLGKIVGSEDWQ